MKIQIKINNKSKNQIPEYKTNGASGFDFMANLDEDIVIKPFERVLIPTGLHFDIPNSMELQVRPRSGLAAKNGITVLNTPGTVDSDYTGEVKIILINLGSEDFIVKNGDRIAQGVIQTVFNNTLIELVKTDSEIIKHNSQRNYGGFGSTGIN